ncbi:NeuD/PglB/VioB family sugar acetyltransferase [Dysgonomonas sp. Marseille-P4677]|uniref:NeuD/PglB/VioB family sugar acetyltransferase n=1 Tax=Dysgonomonas sp. Marseille-P4677 TaxID=2364790 RepID=UPI001912354C|nr:NeuD/PglB/VioB family sugar acetyltransferase [Dysgonomonas sp. Marseille-P4677]MBK5721495.1 NeuD/PglB/VioB family sugar acetyltransferase [Dysgonomonas sp. Marseille-P4677]
MRNLIVFGAGDLGKFIVYNIEMFDSEYNLLGFIDEDISKVGKEFCGLPIFDIDYLQSNTTDELCIVIAISSPVAKEAVAEKLKPYGVEYPNFISPNTWLSKGVKIGHGVLIYPNSLVDFETEIGDFVTINAGCSVGHNVIIGQFSTLAPGVNLAGFTQIEEKANLGIGCCSIQKIKIGSCSTIGGQAMLTKDVESRRTVAGVPAKIIK